MQQILRQSYRDPAWVAVLVSLFLSLVIVLSDDLINSDGILYSEVATKILNGDWRAAISGFSWPFYPLLVGTISKYTAIHFEIVAHVLNASLLALLAYMFVRCSQLMGADRLVAICAAALLLTNVTINGYRDYIIRDFGYWAFFFTALFFFLEYYRTKLTRHALGFGLSMLVATLFRLEGIVFIVLAPVLILFQSASWRERLYLFVKPLLPAFVAAGFVLVAIMFAPGIMERLSDAAHDGGRLLGPLAYLEITFHGILDPIFAKARLLEEVVLDVNSRDMGTESMIAILVMMLVVKVISASGYIPLFFSIMAGFSSRIRHSIVGFNLIMGFLAINSLVLIIVVVTKSFLTPRYAITFALLMSLPAAFAMADFLRTKIPSAGQVQSVWRKRGKVFLIVVLVYMFLDGLTSFSAGKAYIADAGRWIKNNVPAEARLISNEEAVYYYSGRNVDRNILMFTVGETRFGRLPPIGEAFKYDYIAIWIGRKQKGFEEQVIKWSGSKLIYQTENERGDKVLVFKVNR